MANYSFNNYVVSADNFSTGTLTKQGNSEVFVAAKSARDLGFDTVTINTDDGGAGVSLTFASASNSQTFFSSQDGFSSGSAVSFSTGTATNYLVSVNPIVDGSANALANDGSLGTYSANTSMTPCFASGTRILTTQGEVAVEHLAVGDLIVTASGEHRPVAWIGRRRVHCARHPDPEAVWPIRVQAGAFSLNRPVRDLWLSPDHAVLVTCLDEALIPVRHLVNGASIMQVARDEVTYWHVELDSHDILLAEGLPTESFLDTGVRCGFENAGEHTMLHPDFTPLTLADFCRPLIQAGPVVDAMRSRLLAQARSLGWTTSAEDGLHVVADGVGIWPEISGDLARFHVPAATAELRISSRHFVPEQVDLDSRDGRRLGVALRGLLLSDGLDFHREVEIDDPVLAAGFNYVQADGDDRWRWTDGDATLPPELWARAGDAFVLTLRRAPDRGTMRAWVEPERVLTQPDRRVA